jgi:hypothetical protein
MSESSAPIQYDLAPDEKFLPVMAYTENSMIWGDVIVKDIIRVSTWLRTTMVPDHIHLFNARSLLIASGSPSKAAFFKELHLPTSKINAFHLIPPAKDPLDYDPNEPNRKMEPVSILVGPFRMDGYLRLANKATLSKYIDVAHELFTSLYDVEVSYPSQPALGVVHVPFVLARMAVTTFATRKDTH